MIFVKRLISTAAIVPFLTVGAVSAQQLDIEAPPESDLEIDNDADVTVNTADELDLSLNDEASITASMNTALYMQADEDGDNYLDEDEFESYVNARADASSYVAVQSREDYDFWYTSADADEDDRLNPGEFRNSMRMIADAEGMQRNYRENQERDIVNSANDQNLDLDIDEVTDDEDTGRSVLVGDQNQDGYYNRAEFRSYVNAWAAQDGSPYANVRDEGAYKTYFQRADKNDDGRLTEAELNAQVEKITTGNTG